MGANSIALIVSKSTICYLAWQVVSKLYLNNYATIFNTWILNFFWQNFRAITENPLCVIFKDKVNAIKVYDARCISNRNIAGKMDPIYFSTNK